MGVNIHRKAQQQEAQPQITMNKWQKYEQPLYTEMVITHLQLAVHHMSI